MTRIILRRPAFVFNRPLELCPPARSLESRNVAARAFGAEHLLERQSPDAVRARPFSPRNRSGTFHRAQKRIHQCRCAHASDTRPATRQAALPSRSLGKAFGYTTCRCTHRPASERQQLRAAPAECSDKFCTENLRATWMASSA